MLEKARVFLVDYIRKRRRNDEESSNSDSCVEITEEKMKELDEQRQENSRKPRRIGDMKDAEDADSRKSLAEEDIKGDEGDKLGDACVDRRCARCPEVPGTDREVLFAQVDVKVRSCLTVSPVSRHVFGGNTLQ
eukprot:1181621-Prorocentrum_minimum.AAC.1